MDDSRDRQSSSGVSLTLGAVGAAFVLMFCTVAQIGAAEQGSKTKGADAPPNGPTILIEAKFFDLNADSPERLSALPWLKDLVGKPAVASLQGIFSKEQSDGLVKALNSTKGVDLLATPRVTTRSGQEAVIEIGREFRYPTEWKKDEKTGGWEPTAFESKNRGLTFKVLAAVGGDLTLDLQLHPTVVELVGFSDLDAPAPAGAAGTVVYRTAEELPAGRRSPPVFATRTINTSVSIFRGQSVLVQLGVPEAGNKGSRRVFALVTADVVEPEAKKEEEQQQAAKPVTPARAPVVVTADEITFDNARGTLTASGDVKVETAEATLLAQNVEVQPKKTAGGKGKSHGDESEGYHPAEGRTPRCPDP